MESLSNALNYIHPGSVSGALFYAFILVAASVAGSALVRMMARSALQRDRVDRTAVLFLRPLAVAFVWLMSAVIYAHLIPELRALGTALLAGVSVASIVVGMAAQNTLGNTIAGLALLIYRPFRLGDRLQIVAPTGLETGVVEGVTLGYTVLQTFDNRRVVMPNNAIVAQTTVNLTSVDPRVMAVIPIGVGYEADVEKARELLLAYAGSHASVIEVVACPVVALASSSLTLSLRAWCPDSAAAKTFEYDTYEYAKRAFGEVGIEIPYPYTNVVLKREA